MLALFFIFRSMTLGYPVVIVYIKCYICLVWTLYLHIMGHKNIFPTNMLTYFETYKNQSVLPILKLYTTLKFWLSLYIRSNFWYNSNTINIADFYVVVMLTLFILIGLRWYIYKNQHSILDNPLKKDMSNQKLDSEWFM